MMTGRHYGLDWLRIGAFGLLIFYHVGMFFVPWDWHVKTAQPANWVAIPMLASNAWRLALLFAVSGYASASLLARNSAAGAFARSRSARLLIPLLFAMIFVVPPQPWVELRFKHDYPHGFGWFWLHDYFDFKFMNGIAVPTWQHLWFVVYLWVYSMVLALGLAVLPATVRQWIRNWFDRLLGGPGLLILPLVWFALCELVLFYGKDDTHGLFDDMQAHVIYLPVFLFGVLLPQADRVWAAIRAWWPWLLALAVAGYLIVATIEFAYPGKAQPPEYLRMLFFAGRLVQGWCAVIGLIGLADRYWNRDGRWRATLTEAVFPFYIIHQTIIVVAGWWLLPFTLHPLIEFVLLVAVTAAGCWIFYDVGRRLPWLCPLIGLRSKPKLKPDAPDGAAAPRPVPRT